MTDSGNPTPTLTAASTCDAGLNFYPKSIWPGALPAVAVNRLIIAGWGQKMVFNYEIDVADKEKIAGLFRSLYFELSFGEMAQLLAKAKNYSSFPTLELLKRFQFSPTDLFFNVAENFLTLPAGFQDWCIEKKINPNDLTPLNAAKALNLNPVLLQILNLRASKAVGVQCLEICIDLLLMGHLPEEVLGSFHDAEAWNLHLKRLRFPETTARDEEQSKKMSKLPWPGTSHARWLRQGDRAGIELKLFVSNPSDLKKYLTSLGKVQSLMEQDEDPKRAH
jgi:hypothetical protein